MRAWGYWRTQEARIWSDGADTDETDDDLSSSPKKKKKNVSMLKKFGVLLKKVKSDNWSKTKLLLLHFSRLIWNSDQHLWKLNFVVSGSKTYLENNNII